MSKMQIMFASHHCNRTITSHMSHMGLTMYRDMYPFLQPSTHGYMRTRQVIPTVFDNKRGGAFCIKVTKTTLRV
jgi:hypothetical protein